MDYFEKVEKNPDEDLGWNIPERAQGSVNIIGGNANSFRTEIKVAEFLANHYKIKEVNVILPDALKGKLPDLPNIQFLPSTESGSFDESQELINVFGTAEFNLILGDLSKNSMTARALASAYKSSEKSLLITRDAVDLLTETGAEKTLMNENLVLFASVAQLQKLLRAIYYPKMLLLSQSLVQVAEVLHKFTLSYPISVVTLHNEQILIASSGTVRAMPLSKTGYAPLDFWNGELAAKITALNLFNPNNFIGATTCAAFD